MDNYRIPHQRQARVRVSPEEQFARLLEVNSRTAAMANVDLGATRLLTVATALRTASPQLAPAPLSADARAAMRQRLVAVATVSAFDQTAGSVVDRRTAREKEAVAYRMRRRLVALAGSFTIVTGFAGVGVAAAHSLPGDAFYGLKRTTESIQLWATHGDAAKGKLHLAFARTRLAEAEKLPANSSHLASTLAAMNTQTRQGTSELVSAYQSSHSNAPLATLVTFSQQQYVDLTKLATQLPANLQQTEVTALNVLAGVTDTVRSVSGQNCLSCLVTNLNSSKVPTTTPPATQPTRHGATTSPRPTPSKSASSGGGTSGHQSPGTSSPSQTPGGLLHSLLPSNLQPSNLLPGLLGNGKNGTKSKHHPKPLLSPIPLISSLVKTLGL